nr:glycosyltransferase [Methylobacterium sp. Leaf399]
MGSPIFIVSYNRPQYLRQTLEGLRASVDLSSDPGRDVWLFQDAAYSSYYDVVKTDPKLIDECVEIFHRIFPQGKMRRSSSNLGIALNIDAAEQCAFVEHDNEAAIFFEDDLVPSPRYIEILDRLIEQALGDERIGMVSAYGSNVVVTVEAQERSKTALGRMHHNWGFGLTRRHWRERNELVRPYIDAISLVDYSDRPYLPIYKLWLSRGYGPLPSNQDLFKNVATNELGRVRISTATVNAKYIGEEGEHYTPDLYNSIGFDKTEIFDYKNDAVELDQLSAEKYEKFLEIDRNALTSRKMPPLTLIQSGLHLDLDWAKLPCAEKSGVKVFFPVGAMPGMWMKSKVSIPFECKGITRIEIVADIPKGEISSFNQVSTSFPGGETIPHDLTINEAQTMITITMTVPEPPSERFAVDITTLPTLSPFMKGTGADRRQLVWKLRTMTVEAGSGTATFANKDLADLLSGTEAAIG